MELVIYTTVEYAVNYFWLGYRNRLFKILLECMRDLTNFLPFIAMLIEIYYFFQSHFMVEPTID